MENVILHLFAGGFLSVIAQDFFMMVEQFIAVGHICLCKLSHVLAYMIQSAYTIKAIVELIKLKSKDVACNTILGNTSTDSQPAQFGE